MENVLKMDLQLFNDDLFGWLKEEISKEEFKPDEVVEKFKKELPKSFIPKGQYNELSSKVEELEGQITERDNQLKELQEKSSGNEELERKLEELQEKNKKTQEEYEQKLQETKLNHALEKKIESLNPKKDDEGSNELSKKAIKSLLDLDIVKLEGDEVKGLDDQLESIKTKASYLLENDDQEEKGPRFSTGEHKGKDEKDLKDQFIEAFKPK